MTVCLVHLRGRALKYCICHVQDPTWQILEPQRKSEPLEARNASLRLGVQQVSYDNQFFFNLILLPSSSLGAPFSVINTCYDTYGV